MEKRVRQVGLSNVYDLELFYRLLADSPVQPSVLQNRFLSQSSYDRDLRRLCRQRKIEYQSFWTLTANPHILKSPTLRSIAAKNGKTETQVFFNYLNARGITPLAGTTNQQHMAEAVACLAFEIEADELDRIDTLIPH
jgi:diketogulonate reductase-like aldo/keto reductase